MLCMPTANFCNGYILFVVVFCCSILLEISSGYFSNTPEICFSGKMQEHVAFVILLLLRYDVTLAGRTELYLA